MLPAGFDSAELQRARDYDNILADISPMMDFMAFDEDVEWEDEAPQETPASVDTAAAVSIMDTILEDVDTEQTAGAGVSVKETDDPSTLVPHRQNRFLEMSEFDVGFGLLMHIFGLNRTQYAALREVMSLLRNGNSRSLAQVRSLPNQLSALKNRISQRFPLLDVRKAEVPLRMEKLGTEQASRKTEQQAGKPITADLWFIDPFSHFKTFLSSDIANNMHSGLAHFVDEPTELYHSHSWASSVRTTSGQFAHILGNQTGEDGRPIHLSVVFPSDFVLYCCLDSDYVCQYVSGDHPHNAHVGRVYGVGKDYRSDYCTKSLGDIVLQIQEVFEPASKRDPDKLPAHPFGETVEQEGNEFILNLTPAFIPETYLVSRINNKVSVGYYHGETHEDPSPSLPMKPRDRARSKPKPVYPKYEHQPTVPD